MCVIQYEGPPRTSSPISFKKFVYESLNKVRNVYEYQKGWASAWDSYHAPKPNDDEQWAMAGWHQETDERMLQGVEHKRVVCEERNQEATLFFWDPKP